MADYFTHFSCTLDLGSAENVAAAFSIFETFATELEADEGVEPGFDLEADDDTGPGALWIHGDGFGDPEHVIAFVLRCAEAFDLTGGWGFAWALTCSKPRLDGFGGGTQLLDLGERRSLAWIDCLHWLDIVREPGVDPTKGVGIVTPN
jgi:hypothetical protein